MEYWIESTQQKGTMIHHIFSFAVNILALGWFRRLKIATQAVQGLAFLHVSQKEFVYYQFKTSAMYIVRCDLNAKLSEFMLKYIGRPMFGLMLHPSTCLVVN